MDLLEAPRPAYMLSGEEALATLDALHAEMSVLQTYRLEVLARLDETGHTKEISGQSTAGFVASRHRLNPPETQRDLKLALALPKYPAVSAALPDVYAPPGPDPAIQYADPSADVQATDILSDDAVPDDVVPGDAVSGDALSADALSGDAVSDGVLSDDPVAADGLSGDELPVLLHPSQAEAIVAALEAVPAAAMVPVEDLQAAEDQMVKAARNLSPWDLKKLGKRVRDVLDTDGPEPAEDAARQREALRITNADHGVKFSGFLAAENAALFKTSIEAAAKPRPTLDGERDPRTLEKRQADALSDTLAIAAAAGELPGHGGIKPHITITIDYDELKNKGRDATGDLHFGDRLSAAAVRRLACDAEVIPVVLGSESEPLDVGRGQRYVTKAMWRVLARRDKGCVVCGMPPRYSHAHHIIHWIDGGPTSVENLVFLCSVHHTAVHHGHYTITITKGKVHVTRPSWADPPRTTGRRAWFTTPRTGAAATSHTGTSTTPGTGTNTSSTGTSTSSTGTSTPGTGTSTSSTGVAASSRATGPTTPATGTADSSRASGSTRSRAGSSNIASTSAATAVDSNRSTGAGSDGSTIAGSGGVSTSLSGGSTSRPAWATTPAASGTSPAASHAGDGSPALQGETTRADTTQAAFGVGNDPFWGEGPPEQTLRPVRAFPMVGDPPPLATHKPADFDPWGLETQDTG
ncbi:DUF222 domain-containing protein [Kribbella sp. NPDC006257]|uniref:HNH endonuclease signature motif containing protein n=1 Tax=Kribbella sp. NPDC006257 TaxID=3156738 RepID=UPI0033B8707F